MVPRIFVLVLGLVLVSLTSSGASSSTSPDTQQPLVTSVEKIGGPENPASNQNSLSAMTGGPCPPPCLVHGNGMGSVDLPAPCPYVGDDDFMYIIDGLPAATNIEIEPVLQNFFNIIRTPGGSLGGEILDYGASLTMTMQGTGTLAGFSRNILIPLPDGSGANQMHNAPHGVGPVQSFQCVVFRLFGQIIGDPDFDLLRITAGTDFGLPSPGHTTLTDLGASGWKVDSFFDITYRIDFVGAPGGQLAGMSGSTTGTIRMTNAGHDFWDPTDPHKMHFPQLPNPLGWDVYASGGMILGDDWQCSETGYVKDIHFWGGWRNQNTQTITSFDISIASDVPAGITLPYSHPGNILWTRNITDWCEREIFNSAPEGWYDPQSGQFFSGSSFSYFQYDIELDSLDWFQQSVGTIYWLIIRANVYDPNQTGARWGWKSSVDHFNDDAVYFHFIPGGCVAPDNGGGTANLPACPYPSNGTFDIIDGLPPLTEINSNGVIQNYFNVNHFPGGSLGGNVDTWQAFLSLNMLGSGALAGFNRFIQLPIIAQVHNGPRVPFSPIQSFPTDMFQLQGQIVGDPDFDLLRITAGTNFGLPSPGHTTLTQIPNDMWNVESFFDITYRIDFVGAPGGPLAGMSGSTTGTVRVEHGNPVGGGWDEMFEPPLFVQSLDLSFVITDGTTAAPCDCIPGDADGNGIYTVSDAVYLINYIFAGGPAPVPYLTCSGDANCDCQVTISDAVYLINFIFAGGPAPCDCDQWGLNCGLPLH